MLQGPHDPSLTLQPALAVPADVKAHLEAGDRQATGWTRAAQERQGQVPSETALRNTQEKMRRDAEPRRLDDLNTEVGVKFWGEAAAAVKEKLAVTSRRGLPEKQESVPDTSSQPDGGD